MFKFGGANKENKERFHPWWLSVAVVGEQRGRMLLVAHSASTGGGIKKAGETIACSS